MNFISHDHSSRLGLDLNWFVISFLPNQVTFAVQILAKKMLTRAKKSNQNQIIGGQTASRKSTMTVMRISIPFALRERPIAHPAPTPLINEKN